MLVILSNDILILFFPIRLIIITMTKIYIFLMTLIILAVSRRVTNKPPPSGQKEEAIAFEQSHPIQFEELQPTSISYVASESDLPNIFEYSQVESIYPHAKVHLEESKIPQKQVSGADTPKPSIDKNSAKQQNQNQYVEQKFIRKHVGPVEKNETVFALPTKRPKQLKQAQQVFSSGPSSLSLRKENSEKIKVQSSFSIANFTNVFYSQSLLIVLLVLCLLGLFLLSTCCKNSNNYQRLNPNDQQSSSKN